MAKPRQTAEAERASRERAQQLLDAEERTERRIAAAFALLVLLASRLPGGRRFVARYEASMRAELSAALSEGRDGGRAAALRAWELDAEVLRRELPAEVAPGPTVASTVDDAAETARIAAAVAAVVARWRGRFGERVAEGLPERKAARAATREEATRSTTILAATETAEAFSGELVAQRAEVVAAVEEHGRAGATLALVPFDVWDAVLDRRTCRACEELDGDVRPSAIGFDEPPPLHPHCRCTLGLLLLEAGFAWED